MDSPEHHRDVAQNLITDVVPQSVVDLLEVIDVDHDHRQAHLAHRVQVGERPDLAQEVTPVVQTRQVISNRPLVHLALEALIAGVELQELQ